MADKPDSSTEEKSVPLVDLENPTNVKESTAEILAEMRAEAANTKGPRTTNMGVTRDADGKSNIWALEPLSEVDKGPEVNKLAILGMVFVAVIFAVIFLPQLPFTNPDQL